MLTGRQRQFSFQGRVTIVNVLFVVGDDLAGRNEVGVDENVKMTRALNDIAGRVDVHADGAHFDHKGRGYDRIVGGLTEKDFWRSVPFVIDFGPFIFSLGAFILGGCLCGGFFCHFLLRLWLGGGERRFPFGVSGRFQVSSESVNCRVDGIDNDE